MLAKKSDELIFQSVDVQSQEAIKPDVYAENGYLVFNGIEAVDSVINMLSKMTIEEKQIWEESHNVISARSEFDKLFEEYEKLNTYEEFLNFKRRNIEKLKFNNTDEKDCSIDYPFATYHFLPILNKNGVVKIGESLVKYTKEDHFVSINGDTSILSNLRNNLENKNVIMAPKLKAASYDNDLIYDFPEDNPYVPFYNDRWHKMANKSSNRRLNNELRIDRFLDYEYNYQTNQLEWVRGYTIYLKQRAQKKSWGSWKDYTTRYTYDDLKVKVESYPIWVFDPYTPPVSSEVKPNATIDLFYYVDRIPYDENNVPDFLPIPNISISVLTSCSGFDGDLYRIDDINHSGFPGSGVPYNPVPGY